MLLNFFRVQDLTAANPSGRSSNSHGELECISIPQTCDGANGVPAADDALRQANSARVCALVRDFCRVLNKEDRAARIIACARAAK